HILFPDPWWKPQHQVKRLFSPPFVDMLAAKLRVGGVLFFKSDVQAYGDFVQYLVGRCPQFVAIDDWQARIGVYVPTHREHWCGENGKPVYAYGFERG
ncbi:MAG: hypothetical protein AAF639_28565, partial [Chloroflexota bacterium]